MFTETFSFSSFFPFQIRKKKKKGGGCSIGGVCLSLLCPSEKLTALSLAKTPLLDVKAAS